MPLTLLDVLAKMFEWSLAREKFNVQRSLVDSMKNNATVAYGEAIRELDFREKEESVQAVAFLQLISDYSPTYLGASSALHQRAEPTSTEEYKAEMIQYLLALSNIVPNEEEDGQEVSNFLEDAVATELMGKEDKSVERMLR